jgi:hypothetical protein
MAKKSRITQELANAFPDWTKVRNDEQSVGQSFLNQAAENLETIVTELYRGNHNLFLTTANVAEIDITYRLSLPNSFEFELDNPSQLTPIPVAPTVSGLVGNTWYSIRELDGGVREFWYEAIPDRLSLTTTYSGVNYLLLDTTSEDISYSGTVDIFLENRLSLDISGDSLFSEASNPEGYLRSKVRLTGTSWKDIEESEELSFVYSQTKKTLKTWKEIDTIEAIDFPEVGNIKIYSHSFNLENYPDPYDNISQFSHSRDNLTSFWEISESDWTEDLILLKNKTYAATRALDVLQNRVDKVHYREWELLDMDSQPIIPIDIAPIPYSSRTWALTVSGLYLFDLEYDQPSQHLLMGKTISPLSQISTNRDYVTRGEELEVELRFVRPLKTVMRHRLQIQYPDGSKFGVLEDGTLVATTTKYWVDNLAETRLLRPAIIFELEDLGDYLFTLEVQYLGGDIEIDKRIVRVSSKTAIAEFDINSIIGNDAVGLDIDHLARLLILDSNSDVHHIELHYDQMLIDYEGKELVFREPYDNIKVIK